MRRLDRPDFNSFSSWISFDHSFLIFSISRFLLKELKKWKWILLASFIFLSFSFRLVFIRSFLVYNVRSGGTPATANVHLWIARKQLIVAIACIIMILFSSPCTSNSLSNWKSKRERIKKKKWTWRGKNDCAVKWPRLYNKQSPADQSPLALSTRSTPGDWRETFQHILPFTLV